MLDDVQGGNLEKVAPYLATLPPLTETRFWEYLFKFTAQNPASFSLIASPLELQALRNHLSRFLDVRLEGGLEMMLAFWDPAILACLVGQEDDKTLYVAGPAFSSAQKNTFLFTVHAWWYWDRETNLHRIEGTDQAALIEHNVIPLKLTEQQENILVEASLPDTVLYYLNLNTPFLLDAVEAMLRYQFVYGQIDNARNFGLETIGDIVRFICVVLIYKERLNSDPVVHGLLTLEEVAKLHAQPELLFKSCLKLVQVLKWSS